jgi:hypothetical protein
MKKSFFTIVAFLLVFILFPKLANAKAEVPVNEKEWTFLIFLNGHNNLDPFAEMNVHQMEQVGSTDKINIVVQWASMGKKTKRFLVTKSKGGKRISSPVLQELPPVDMGDVNELVNFVKWGVENFPAKKYFVNIWNHGSGWHRKKISPLDTSYDDIYDSKITTEQLGSAMSEIRKIMGQKIDILGHDACLMAMVEVAAEVSDDVQVMVGSEEVEPGEGWPYSTFLQAWNQLEDQSATAVSKLLTIEYLKAYSGGVYGYRPVTLSALDLTKINELNQAVQEFSSQLSSLSVEEIKQIWKVADKTLAFYSYDSKDLRDFIFRLEYSRIGASLPSIEKVKSSLANFVISNQVSDFYRNASGVAIWLPTYEYEFEHYTDRYEKLKFNQATNWNDFLSKMISVKSESLNEQILR